MATDTVLDTVVPAAATATDTVPAVLAATALALATALATVLAVLAATALALATALATVLAKSVATVLALATVLAVASATTLALATVPPVSAGIRVSATRLLTAVVSLVMDPAPSVSVVPVYAALVSVVPVFKPERPSAPTVLLLDLVSVLPTARNGEYHVTELPLVHNQLIDSTSRRG